MYIYIINIFYKSKIKSIFENQFKSMISSSSNSEAFGICWFCLELLLLLDPALILIACWLKVSAFKFIEFWLSLPAAALFSLVAFFFGSFSSEFFDLLESLGCEDDKSELLGGSAMPSSYLSLLLKNPLMKSFSKSVVLKLITH